MKKFVGFVLELEPESVNTFLEDFRNTYSDIKIIYIKTGYEKIWLVDSKPPEVDNASE